jgi:threonine dehydrogenase-like Zn-dependent dehydrogenase
MVYRAHWMNHAGAVATHNEVTLHAYDRLIPQRPLEMLLVGVGNGGAVEIWNAALPEGSKVIAVDADPRCADLPGLTVVTVDATQKDALREALRGHWFDVVIDATRTMQPYVWPFLRPGGVYIYEGYNVDMALMLTRDLALQDDSWLPIEEVMRVDVYQECLAVEKRTPRVVPYMDIVTGNFADIIPEKDLHAAGVKRVISA